MVIGLQHIARQYGNTTIRLRCFLVFFGIKGAIRKNLFNLINHRAGQSQKKRPIEHPEFCYPRNKKNQKHQLDEKRLEPNEICGSEKPMLPVRCREEWTYGKKDDENIQCHFPKLVFS